MKLNKIDRWICIMTVETTETENENYFKLLQLHNENRIDYSSKQWETVKFFQSIFSALIVATLAAVIAAANAKLLDFFLVRLLISVLPFCGGISLIFGILNLRRETRLLFIEEGTMFKLAHLLKLDKTIPDGERWLSGDQHLLPDKWRNEIKDNENLTFNDWLKARIKRTHFLTLICSLFGIETGIGIGCALIILISGKNW
jgi:hypothetical protein